MKHLAKRLLFPGLDLHTRCRVRWLSRQLRPGPVETLDVGFGNGAMSLAAYERGNRVLGISLDVRQVAKAQAFFRVREPARLEFRCLNAYDLGTLGRQFDQIICLEMLEHVREDRRMIRLFWELLRPGGALHLCCPNALQPEHHLGRVDGPEDGGHVRDGYTFASYQSLLAPQGFGVETELGIGSPLLAALDRPLRRLRHRIGDAGALPLFLLMWPLLVLDRVNPRVPFSVYVLARKPAGA